MLTFTQLAEKKSKIKINPKKEECLEDRKHKEDCQCQKCEDKEEEKVVEGSAYGLWKGDGKRKLPGDKKKKQDVKEAKVDKGRSDYGKATIRNWRHSGPSTVEPAMFDPENKRGKTIDKRRAEHKARRGVKGAKVPTYKKEEYSDWRSDSITIQDADGKDFVEIIDIIKAGSLRKEQKEPKGGDRRPEVKSTKKPKGGDTRPGVQQDPKSKNALQINKIVGTQ